jgi:hypothetical protein
MTQYTIDIGAAPDDGQGDPLRTAFDYTNLNFDQIFAAGPVLSNVAIANSTIRTINTNGNLILAPNGIGRIQANAAVVPSLDNVYDLGSPTRRFNSIYVGTGGLSLATLSVTGNISADYYYGNGSALTGIQATAGTYISNELSNVKIPAGNSNVTITVNTVSNVVVFSTTGQYITGLVSATGNITGANLQATGNIYIGNTVFTRTLTVGTRTTPVTVPLASNNTFDVGLRGGGNVVVYTT